MDERRASRLLVIAVCICAVCVYWDGCDRPGFATTPYAADVADERDLGDRRGRVHHGDRERLPARYPHHGGDCPVCVDDQHRERFSDHRPHAQNVQADAPAGEAMSRAVEHLAYLVAAVLFIFSLHWMNTPKTARRGVMAGVAGMALAILATWIQPQIVHHGWIVIAMVAGGL